MNLWIDTDMGNDDIMAIAMLVQYPQIKIQAISLVNGVSGVEKGGLNIQSTLNFLTIKTQLFKNNLITAYPYSLRFPTQDINRAEELTLLENLPLRNIKNIKRRNLTKLFANLSDNSTLFALGPLTNIATLIKNDLQLFKQKISQIILMGGGIYQGNVPPLRVAEYNIALDPASAKTVFDLDIPLCMVGIDATSQVPCEKDFQQESNKITPQNPAAAILKEMVINNDGDFDQFYDPLTAAILIKPTLVTKSVTQGIEVVTSGNKSGQTKLTTNGITTIPLKIDSSGFYKLLTELMKGNK